MTGLMSPVAIVCILLLAMPARAAGAAEALDLTTHWAGYAALGIFAVAYILAMLEEATELRKSKPMMLTAALIWVIVAAVYAGRGIPDAVEAAFRRNLITYSELLLFIMVSMTYLNAMEERLIFERLRVWLLNRGWSYRRLFWITGVLAFCISAVCNNLTTALLMGAVLTAVGRKSPRFVAVGCINVVNAVNAGGSFSPFGDITTLLVWQSGRIPFQDFFHLLIPSIIDFVVPAAIMHFAIPKQRPASSPERIRMKRGARRIILLFLCTIVTAVAFENLLQLPAAAGMMAGLAFLQLFDFYLMKTTRSVIYGEGHGLYQQDDNDASPETDRLKHFDVFQKVSRLEWDTLLFLYGVMMSVGGLSFIGYLDHAAAFFYGQLSPTVAHVLVGVLSAFIDNGTIMFAVLTMQPSISEGQWLLVTLTTGVGGSMLAIGSAAGVGLLGQAKGQYTFSSHLKWAPVLALGYAAAIAVHFMINAKQF